MNYIENYSIGDRVSCSVPSKNIIFDSIIVGFREDTYKRYKPYALDSTTLENELFCTTLTQDNYFEGDGSAHHWNISKSFIGKKISYASKKCILHLKSIKDGREIYSHHCDTCKKVSVYANPLNSLGCYYCNKKDT
jgi:hypothetical protein